MARTKQRKSVETDEPNYKDSPIGWLDHIRTKPMWAGSDEILTKKDGMTFKINHSEKKLTCIHISKNTLTDATLKCFDELIVNAVDQIANNRELKSGLQVSKIVIDFDPNTLDFSITNDGRGIDISKYPDNDDIIDIYRGKYKPYVYFSCPGQGSNSFKEKECIKAGTNGYGTKIVLAHSREMTVECVNAAQGLHYIHTHKHVDIKKNGKMVGEYVLGEPIITKTGASSSFTKISFRLINEGVNKPEHDIYGEDIEKWLYYRLVYITSYINTFVKTFKIRPVQVLYNGNDLSWIELIHIADAMKMQDTKTIAFRLKPKVPTVTLGDKGKEYDLYPMEIAMIIKEQKFPAIISNTNGTLIEEGKHLAPLFKQVATKIISKISNAIDNSMIKITKGNIENDCIMFVNAILPGLQFGEQSKTKAIVDTAICDAYSLPSNILDEIVHLLLSKVMKTGYNKLQAKLKETIEISNKFTDACARGSRHDFNLLICEGDSAMNAIKRSISSISKNYDINKFGFMTLLGGVPNSRKTCLKFEEPGQEEEKIVIDTMTMKNVFLNTLQKALGLMIGTTAERSHLRYGRVICCVDQDHDGKGKLFGLIVNIFSYFWPELLSNGNYLYRLETPIQRIYAGKKLIQEFYRDRDFYEYLKTNKLKKGQKVHYFKGLGTHGEGEMSIICKNMFDNIKGYKLDELGGSLITKFYDVDSNQRKLILSKPLDYANRFLEKTETQNVVSISDYLMSDVFLFAKDDIIRKLVNAVDGMNNSGRKIINGLLQEHNNQDRTKVAELSGSVTKTQNYHHGETCLNSNIINKCLLTVGGRQLPLMIPHGNFGSRLCGGAGASEPRYISVENNVALTRLLFPEEDSGFLKYTEVEGKVYEPDYFIPILPMAILESMSIPAHGWNFKIWARDVFSVIRIVSIMINNPDYRGSGLIPMATHNFTGNSYYDLRESRDVTEGKFEVYEDRIVISEVPIGRWINKYYDELCMKITFYQLDAVVGLPANKLDKSIEIVIMLGDSFWDKVSKDGQVHMAKISKKEVESVFGKKPKERYSSEASKKKKAKPKAKKEEELVTRINDDTGAIEKEREKGGMKIRTIEDGEKYNLDSFLDLKKSHKSLLNMITIDNDVRLFTDYQDVINYWFDIRKDVYIKRVERQMIIYELRIELLENHIEFITKYDFETKRSKSEMIKEIKRLGIKPFNKSLIENPKGTLAKDLRRLCTADSENDELNISYDYILNMRLIDAHTSEKVDAMKTNFIKLKLEFINYKAKANAGKFRGSMIWLEELDTARLIIKNGVDTWWEEYYDPKKSTIDTRTLDIETIKQGLKKMNEFRKSELVEKQK